MSPRKLRLLAYCLNPDEGDFITKEDRKSWASDLVGFAKSIEREAAQAHSAPSSPPRAPQSE